GRLDLAHLADAALQNHTDGDLALDAFLNGLPALQPPRARLELSREQLPLGELTVGGTKQVELTVRNVGGGLLHGTLSIAEGAGWLRLLSAAGDGPYPLKVADEQTLTFEVDTTGVSPGKCIARLAFLTNGGLAEVRVLLDVTARPFPSPPYQGARTPRQLAVLMKANPRPAIALLRAGEVARWFVANGWPYPVVGLAAPGMAAVQQLFEALGLARPPRIRLAATEAVFETADDELLRGEVELTADERKWLHAAAESNMPWLRVTTPHVGGPQRVQLNYEIDPGGLPVGRHEAQLRITANAGQPLALRVRLDVRRPRTPRRPCLRWVLHGAALGLLLRLALAGPADIVARVLGLGPGVGAGAFASWAEAPGGPEFVQRFVLATWWLGALAGAALALRRGSWRDVPAGLLAGAGAGLAGAATLACLLPSLDGPTRLLWTQLPAWPALHESAWLATLAWVGLAALVWAVGGALLGVLTAVWQLAGAGGRG
ncbi:MAG: hypothetical protein JNM56_14995, partial [Planctomycetia bacterium]|nr:hypothetical protein [Planctomycetia bacterium]